MYAIVKKQAFCEVNKKDTVLEYPIAYAIDMESVRTYLETTYNVAWKEIKTIKNVIIYNNYCGNDMWLISYKIDSTVVIDSMYFKGIK